MQRAPEERSKPQVYEDTEAALAEIANLAGLGRENIQEVITETDGDHTFVLCEVAEDQPDFPIDVDVKVLNGEGEQVNRYTFKTPSGLASSVVFTGTGQQQFIRGQWKVMR